MHRTVSILGTCKALISFFLFLCAILFFLFLHLLLSINPTVVITYMYSPILRGQLRVLLLSIRVSISFTRCCFLVCLCRLQRYESIVEQKNILGSSNGDDESPSPLKTVHVKWRISFCLLQKSRPLLTLHSQNPHSSSCTRKGRGENSKQTMAPVKIHMKSSVITRLPDSVYSKPGCFTIQSMTREKKEERQVCMSSNVNKWMECFRLAGASINHIFVAGWLLIYLTSEEKQKLPRRHRKDKVQYRAVKSTSWRRHFCVLDIQHGLMCFTNKPSLYETKRFDSLELPPPALYFDELLCARARAIEDEAYSKPFCILLESAKFHGRDGIVLMAQNDHDRERWLQAVKEFHESPLR